MNRLHQLARGFLVFALEIQHLSANHAVHSSHSVGNERDNLHRRRGRRVKAGQHLEGARLQSVAGENSYCFSELHVAGGLAAAQIVVIQRRQVVVNQRVGVQHLQSRAQPGNSLGHRAGNRNSCLHGQHRP